MSWPFDTTEPLVTPAEAAEDQRLRRGVATEDWALPPTLVATFQPEAWERLTARAGIDPANVPIGQPAMGFVGGTPVAAIRMSFGAPAAALALEHAIARGVHDILVVGTAGSLQERLPIGSCVLVTGAEREDGTSHHYLPAGEAVAADPGLTETLAGNVIARGLNPVRGRSWTIDAPFRETVGAVRRHSEAGVLVVEMEAAAIFAVARVRGVRAVLVISVSDELFHPRWRPGFKDARTLDTLCRAADAVMDCVAGGGSDSSPTFAITGPGLPPGR